MNPLATSSTSVPHKADAVELSSLRDVAVRGAMWVTILSALGLVVSYLRTWILGKFGNQGEVLGAFAALLILVQAVSTVATPGGAAVMSALLPKVSAVRDKAAFIVSYALLGAVLAICLASFIVLAPPFQILADVRLKIGGDAAWLALLVPCVVAYEMAVFCLSGLMQFRLSALLTQVPLFTVTLVAGAALVVWQPDAAGATRTAYWALGSAYAVSAGVGVLMIVKSLPAPSSFNYFPDGFWKYTAFVHLNSICTFAFTNIDLIFVGSLLSTRELAAYFALLQCAMLITFVPQKVGQVLLSTFSRLLATAKTDEISIAYRKLCDITLLVSTPLATLLILFSRPIAHVFGDWLAPDHLYLVFLAGAIFIGALGSLNAMLVLAHQWSGPFLANSVILTSIQFVVTWFTVGQLGVYGVIAGKAAGILAGQAGLLAILHLRLRNLTVAPPTSYWSGLGTVAAGMVYALARQGSSAVESFSVFALLCLVYFAVNRTSLGSMRLILQAILRRRGPNER